MMTTVLPVGPLRMVRLLTASSPMEAKVIAARLGAEGFVWELRGSVDGPLAMGPIEILVDADDLDDARALMLVEEIESSFTDSGTEPRETTMRDVLAVAAVLVLVLLFAFARMLSRV